jgi:hypothetical protein
VEGAAEKALEGDERERDTSHMETACIANNVSKFDEKEGHGKREGAASGAALGRGVPAEVGGFNVSWSLQIV